MRSILISVNCLAAVVLFTSGCAERPGGAAPNQTDATAGHDHGSGPHGGTIADWGGGKYHVEFTVDHDKQQATVYLLGDDAATPAPLAAETLLLSIKEPQFQVELAAAPSDGDPEMTASRFVGQHESLGIVREFEGTISGQVDDTPYAGDFSEQAGHDHQHD